jgi:phosphoglucosamine mutase
MNKKLFGTDGIRGKAGKFLNSFLALKVAMSSGIFFSKKLKTKKVLLGKDTRLSGYMIEDAIVSGLTAVGYDIIQVGPIPTPAVAFLTEDMRCDAGIMISASHNHFSDNGIKFFDNQGNKLSAKDEQEIEDIYYNEKKIEENLKIDGNIGSSRRIEDAIGRYIVHLKNSFPKNMSLHGLRIVLDVANGASYRVGPTVFEELGAEVITINNKPNGTNINENCGALYPLLLADSVKKYRADIGFALDGDADRLVVVDQNGETVDGDQLLGALALYLKESNILSKNAIVTTLMSNQALEDFLKNNNIKLFRSAVGDKNVLEMMKKNSINFGGEQSGHIIVSDFAKTGDGLMTALQVLAYTIKHKNKSVSELLRPFKLYPSILENINVSKKPPLEKIKGFNEQIKELESKNIRHLIRYSGTENLLRILLEGKDLMTLEKKVQDLKEFFKKALND